MTEKNDIITEKIDDTKETISSDEELVEEIKDLTKEEILKDKIIKLEEELNTTISENLKIRAEFDNFRKRNNKERDTAYHMATINTVERILPVIDNFDRAMQSDCNDPGFKDGINLILSQFSEVLTSIGVEEIDALGETFNPEFHNAVLHEENNGVENNTVVEILQKGYKLGNVVLRHAMVKVAN